MSWSIRITALYIGFVILILSLVFISSHNKEELVSKDYYAQELKYQERIDAINNTKALTESITHVVNTNEIVFTIPADLKAPGFSGEIYFFCPSSSVKDTRIKMHFGDDNRQVIKKSQLQPGIYKMKMNWAAAGKNYFKEEVITVR